MHKIKEFLKTPQGRVFIGLGILLVIALMLHFGITEIGQSVGLND